MAGEKESHLLRIGNDLHDAGKLNSFMFRVWKMHTEGFTFREIRTIIRAGNMDAELLDSDEMRKRQKYLGNSATSLKRYYERIQVIVEAEAREEALINSLGGCPEDKIGYTGERSGDPHFFTDGVLVKFIRK